MKKARTIIMGNIMLAISLLAIAPATAQSATAVPQLDLNRYMGVWYEQARLPYKREKTCLRDTMVLYAPADKPLRFQMVTSCHIKDGNTDAWNANGRFSNKKVQDGRLRISYLWPFSQKYWVIALGPDYDWALVGSPNHKSLWLLSRIPIVKPEVLDEMKSKATAAGFKLDKLITVPQQRRPASTTPVSANINPALPR